MKEVHVIVNTPVYNGFPYFTTYFNCIHKLTYQNIILINDGSDDSASILMSQAESDKRIKLMLRR